MFEEVSTLEERGRLRLDLNATELRQYHGRRINLTAAALIDFKNLHMTRFFKQLEDCYGPATRLNWERITLYYAYFWLHLELEAHMTQQIKASPGPTRRELHAFWYELLRNPATQHSFDDLPVPAQNVRNH
jgi:hypothetical protein